jgi:hypothetical protein
MIVCKPGPDEGYQWAMPVDQRALKLLRQLRGKRVADSWTPIWVYLITNDEDGPRKKSDMPWLSAHAPILTRRAKIPGRERQRAYSSRTSLSLSCLDVADQRCFLAA